MGIQKNKQSMLLGWRIWAVLAVFLTLVAEGLNHLTPELEFLQWLLFTLAMICFIIGITAWDRQGRRGKR